jgi:hypothetical protein
MPQGQKTHAHRQHYEIAILVAGDADYLPVVRLGRIQMTGTGDPAKTQSSFDRTDSEVT